MKVSFLRSFLFIAVTFTLYQSAFPQPTAFGYQGVVNIGGTTANGNFDFEFTLFDALLGGSQSQTITVLNVVVTNGLFNVRLDFGDSVFPGANRFLEVRIRQSGVGSYTTLTPRQPVASAPYSIQSLNAANATNALQLGGLSAAGFIKNSSTLQPTSNFNISGNGIVGGNVGIGTTAPARRLHVANGTSGASSLSTSDVVIEDDAAAFQHFITPDDVESGILFGDPTASISGGIIFNNAATNNGIQFRAGGNTTRMTLDGSGNLGIGTTAPIEKLEVKDGAVLLSGAGSRVTVNNPSNQSASVSLGWGTDAAGDVARIRYGGNGAGSTNGFVIQGPGDTNRLKITNNGSLVVGTQGETTSDLFVNGKIYAGAIAGPGTNAVCSTPEGVLGFRISNCSSSIRYKSNVRHFSPGFSLLNKLQPVYFNWKDSGTADVGLVAEEVARIEPLLTTTNEKGEIEGVKYDRIGVVLINAVKEQQRIIENQQRQIDELKGLVCLKNRHVAVCKEVKK